MHSLTKPGKLAAVFSFMALAIAVSILKAQSVPRSADVSRDWWPSAVTVRLDDSGDNANEILSALMDCPVEHREELAFLIQHMPGRDLKALSAEFLLENIRLADEARAAAKWTVPDSIFLNDVLPYASVDETRETWRAEMRNRCLPIVSDCATSGEAALKLNRELFLLVNVKYSTSREKPNQSPSESIHQTVASCTGLSILLVDACRSVGVPARVAGTPSWTSKRGNHTWVEIWDSDWHFVGAAEPDDQGLDRGWFIGDAAMADDQQPMNRIYATSFAETGMYFPLVWSMRDTSVPGVNVTQRYAARGQTLPADHARVLVAAYGEVGKRVAAEVQIQNTNNPAESWQGTTRAGTADMNDVLEFQLPRNLVCQVTLTWNGQTLAKELVVSDQEQTFWRLEFPASAEPKALAPAEDENGDNGR